MLANVQIAHDQIGGTNTQVFKTLEKNLKDYINNTSWTGKRLKNFEKINCNFSIIISERPGQNSFKGSIVVQSTRPVYNSEYNSPILNINDTDFAFDYIENENLVFNERSFSGKNLLDVISFYVYIILGTDADTFQLKGGQKWFDKAMKISQNSQTNNTFGGWSQNELKTRGKLIGEILNSNNNTLREVYYYYHRTGLDNMYLPDPLPAKKAISQALMRLSFYQNNFQTNYPFNIFIDAKKEEIFGIFNTKNNQEIDMKSLKTLFYTFAPRDIETKWSKWK